jgi:hypothetical protein
MVLASMRKAQGFEVQRCLDMKQAPFTNKPPLESFCATRRPDESQPGWNAVLMLRCFLFVSFSAERINDANGRLTRYSKKLRDWDWSVWVPEIGTLIEKAAILCANAKMVGELVVESTAKDHRQTNLFAIGRGILCRKEPNATSANLSKCAQSVYLWPPNGVRHGRFIQIGVDRALRKFGKRRRGGSFVGNKRLTSRVIF